ncbi:MAG: vWA domain-containing protein [Candidatus Micrarchaeota archaeon]
MTSRGQASVEFMLILAAAIVIITMIILISQEQIRDVSRLKDQNDARNSLLDLSSAAREVYAQGEGSRKLVYVVLPGSYEPEASFVGNRSIRIRSAGTDHVTIENFNVRGYLPGSSGAHWVWVVSEGNRVRIGDAMLELDKNRIYLVMSANSTASEDFTVTNIWVRDIDVTATPYWSHANVSMSGLPPSFSLGVNGTRDVTLQFAASETAGGIYAGSITLYADDNAGRSEDVDIPVTVQVIPLNGSYQTTDIQGPIVTAIYQDPIPAVKLQPLAVFVNASDALTGNNIVSGCELDADSANNWQDMLPMDGAFDQAAETALFNYTSGFALGPHVLRARCTDIIGNTGPVAYYYFNVSEADTLGPIVVQMHHTEYPTTLSNITVGGVATDSYTGISDVVGCSVKVDSGGWFPAAAVDGAWDSPTENFTYQVGPLPVGFHEVFYQCTDSIGNVGGIYNDSFGVVDVDLVVVLDRSGSMADNVTDAAKSYTSSASSTGWSWVKDLTVLQKNGDVANLTAEIRASASGCTVEFNATIDGVTVATGSRNSTTYGYIMSEINVSQYEAPYVIDLYIRRDTSGCTAYNRLFSLQQQPSKMDAAKSSAKTFVDVAGNDLQMGLVSYSTSSTTDRTLMLMGQSNQSDIKAAIDALNPSGNTCIECGLVSAANELVSSRSRPTANKVIVLLTDGLGNVGDSVDGAVYCRERNITVYTIGFGYDVDETELTNIALLTNGDYYFAPNAETLTAIFQSIGKNN